MAAPLALSAHDERVQRLIGYLNSDPTNLALLADVADTMLNAGRPEAARPWVERALRQVPDDSAWRYRMAVVHRQLGDLPQARELLDSLLRAGVDEPAVRLELTSVAYAQGDWAGAVQAAEPLLSQTVAEPIAAQACFMALRSLHQCGEVARAILLGEAFLAANPDAPVEVKSALATLYLDGERLEDAAQLYAQVQHAGALDAEMLAVGGFVAMQAAEPDEALRRFERSAAAAPQMGRSLLGLGLAHAAIGHLDQARAALEKATVAMPTHLGTWHALAWMHLLGRDLDAAERMFKHTLELDRNFGDTHGGLAIVSALRGQREQAEEHIRVGQRLDRRSLNVGAAKALLQNGGHMDDPNFLEQGLKMLYAQALSRDAAQKTLFEQLLTRNHGAPPIRKH
jgi:tetratricopeptide (TPR) repeat protein